MIIWWGTFICMAGAGTIVFHYGIQKAKRKSLRSMKSFEKPGEEWNPKKMKKYVKHAYFVIQECWRRQDTSYAEKLPEQKSYSKLEFETGLDGSKS